ncbi:AraC family transcriptional regulator of adaptative response/methylated-DNA-[protein]-cysteine methyltransferase [Chitinophaga skermanii]|uniref:methylated-DNA--[protein]-cysteine S-methyltransferase n=1 Tax=Chitinophaga skermanii TaxID=331697 RepID=A0A327Q876_9BACT|nr:methylated-DNA--[protein]-cysteine S-methyltransferase [Chitinophaga skermanii]RAI99452.1 AraC family transcriptional regulator of adaptative response/methylated-DNA-[protein]-cysteine methyltransferase [Chitinophaga skermanii]
MENESHFNYDRMAAAIAYLAQNFRKQPALEEVAKEVHMSEFHFQRVFTEWAGVSPKKFLQYLTTNYLKSRIKDATNISEAADWAGLSAQSRVYDLFVTLEAVTPQEFKEAGRGVTIHYGFQATPFGECFIAVTNRGICGLEFIQEENHQAILENFKKDWKNAIFKEDSQLAASYVQKIFHGDGKEKLNVIVKGTNFQVKVWEALLRIPPGELTTYSQIAQSIEKAGAERAVGNAVGSNPIAFLIPCHRVIRKEGALGGYHWGITRKQAILGCEMAQRELAEQLK